MGSCWPETRAKNAQGKTAEGVGREGRRLRETRNVRFLDANALHIARMIELRVAQVQGAEVGKFLKWWPCRGSGGGRVRKISWRVGWPHVTTILRVY